MFSVDNTQETLSSLYDYTQDMITSDKARIKESRKSLLYDEQILLEETIREVRKLRPKLLEFLEKFREQQKQVRQLKKKNANLEKDLAGIISTPSTRNDSVCISRNGKITNEKLRSFVDAVKSLVVSEDPSKMPLPESSRTIKRDILENARNELSQANSVFRGLEDIYKEEQRRLFLYQERNKSLKGKLLMAQRKHRGKAMSGNGSASLEPAPPLCVIADYCSSRTGANSLSLLLNDREPQTVNANCEGELPNSTLCVKEKEQYRLRFDFFASGNSNRLQYIHKVSRFRVKVFRKVFAIGSCSCQDSMQNFVLPPETAPEGLFHRGKYRIKSQIIDENGRVLITWHWTLKVVKN